MVPFWMWFLIPFILFIVFATIAGVFLFRKRGKHKGGWVKTFVGIILVSVAVWFGLAVLDRVLAHGFNYHVMHWWPLFWPSVLLALIIGAILELIIAEWSLTLRVIAIVLLAAIGIWLLFVLIPRVVYAGRVTVQNLSGTTTVAQPFSWRNVVNASDTSRSCVRRVTGVTMGEARRYARVSRRQETQLWVILIVNDKSMSVAEARQQIAKSGVPDPSQVKVIRATAIHLYTGPDCTESVYSTPGAWLSASVPLHPRHPGEGIRRDVGVIRIGAWRRATVSQ